MADNSESEVEWKQPDALFGLQTMFQPMFNFTINNPGWEIRAPLSGEVDQSGWHFGFMQGLAQGIPEEEEEGVANAVALPGTDKKNLPAPPPTATEMMNWSRATHMGYHVARLIHHAEKAGVNTESLTVARDMRQSARMLFSK